MIDYLKSGIKKKPQAMLNLLINKIILYDDKIEIHYNYTENNDPDGDDRDFVLYAALFQDIKKQTKPNLIVQLSLSWLHDLDVNWTIYSVPPRCTHSNLFVNSKEVRVVILL